jgi:hypothetical protein
MREVLGAAGIDASGAAPWEASDDPEWSTADTAREALPSDGHQLLEDHA